MYLYIMDYCQCAIYEIEYDDKKEDDDIERFLKEYGLNIDECDYMYSETKLCIEKINKINDNSTD